MTVIKGQRGNMEYNPKLHVASVVKATDFQGLDGRTYFDLDGHAGRVRGLALSQQAMSRTEILAFVNSRMSQIERRRRDLIRKMDQEVNDLALYRTWRSSRRNAADIEEAASRESERRAAEEERALERAIRAEKARAKAKAKAKTRSKAPAMAPAMAVVILLDSLVQAGVATVEYRNMAILNGYDLVRVNADLFNL